jgi:hypothetical protein
VKKLILAAARGNSVVLLEITTVKEGGKQCCPGDFFILIFFNYSLRNKSDEKFFLNLVLLSHTNPYDATYERVVTI